MLSQILFYSWNAATLSTQSLKTSNQRCKLCLCNFKRLCIKPKCLLELVRLQGRDQTPLQWNPLKTGHFQSLNWALQCSELGRADSLAWQFTWRACPCRCCQILQSICPAPDWPKAENTKSMKNIRQLFRISSCSTMLQKPKLAWETT